MKIYESVATLKKNKEVNKSKTTRSKEENREEGYSFIDLGLARDLGAPVRAHSQNKANDFSSPRDITSM